MRFECKEEGCSEPLEDKHGIYGGLCARHKGLKQASRRTEGRPARVAGGAAAVVAKLAAPAKALDRARAKINTLPDRQRLKAAFDESTRRAQQSPTAENLARVHETTKALGAGAPQREKYERELAYAEAAMREALTVVLRELRDHLPRGAGDE